MTPNQLVTLFDIYRGYQIKPNSQPGTHTDDLNHLTHLGLIDKLSRRKPRLTAKGQIYVGILLEVSKSIFEISRIILGNTAYLWENNNEPTNPTG